jgi:hypothetical protein
MGGQIFINYRRDDASHAAGRLSAHFETFLDVDMELGIDFVGTLG